MEGDIVFSLDCEIIEPRIIPSPQLEAGAHNPGMDLQPGFSLLFELI